MRHRRDLHGMERHLHDLWIGALQIVGGLILLALAAGFALGKWVF